MMRTRPAVVAAEAVAAIPALCAGAGRGLAILGLRRRMHLLASFVAVMAMGFQLRLVGPGLLLLRFGDRRLFGRRQLGVCARRGERQGEKYRADEPHALLVPSLTSLRIRIALGGPVVVFGLVLSRAIVTRDIGAIRLRVSVHVLAFGLGTRPGGLLGRMACASAVSGTLVSIGEGREREAESDCCDQYFFHFYSSVRQGRAVSLTNYMNYWRVEIYRIVAACS